MIRAALAVLVVAMAAVPAVSHAQKERWAALSVLGDRMNVIFARMQTGTRTNPNYIEPVMMKDDVLDKLALKAVLDAKTPGNPEIVPLSLRDPRFYKAQENVFASEGRPLLEGLLKALEAQKVTHVLLVTRSRAEAAFKIRDGSIGVGNVEGLGFYIDRGTRLLREETGEEDRGYIAPFAYYQLLLFDIARGAVVAEARVAASFTHIVAGSGQGEPWDVITPQQKVDDLERLLNQNMSGALQRLVAARTR